MGVFRKLRYIFEPNKRLSNAQMLFSLKNNEEEVVVMKHLKMTWIHDAIGS